MNTRGLGLIAVSVALSLALEFMPLHLPFFPLSFDALDLGEIPIMLLAIYRGGKEAMVGAVILWLELNFIGGFVPIGPLFKLIALASAISGIELAIRVTRRMSAYSPYIIFAVSSAIRVLTAVLANYILVAFFMPGFLSYIAPIFGVSVLLYYLFFTGIFNIIQNALSIFPALIATRALIRSHTVKLERVFWKGQSENT
ncbi:MAG: hypothetical protein JRN53_03740 [Nitrososphaerota archaeon]|jgi:hypothetical protein|nr:hypothetical protein [Nitrososphaerota archaeon]MDG7040304.1 hypothetical protein [Nitrososphaerota archaeon]MDG7041955.1 hypothetical protein [Nitrososphaerota archaeon]MDG7042675.1 hypothetical protein [Nitrososphaerota archaeon]MDG7046684.1 hypothetical protein [Nitrososphaerota archaeon]